MSSTFEHDHPDAPANERLVAPSFVTKIIDQDLDAGRIEQVVTRFPPEPNGYLHVGHAKSICLNFGLALDYEGRCHLRFDDTNPLAEDTEYVESIIDDVRWLGFEFGEHLYFASDYFDRMYGWAEDLVRAGKAYVYSWSAEEMSASRGDFTAGEPDTPSPYRERPVEESLDLFRRMRDGEFEDGAHILRAKIDLAHPIQIMRDPPLYRIRNVAHHRQGDTWCIYPMYDFAHVLEDSIEHITHSLCTLEFTDNRAVYDWLLANVDTPGSPRQIEFARLNIEYFAPLSKRKLRQLVEDAHVSGWDDPRMPTIAGLRRRGVTPEAIREFAKAIGLTRTNSYIEIERFEKSVRDDLEYRAPRVMAVLDPLPVVLTNFDEIADGAETVWIEAPSFPENVGKPGSRMVPLTRELVIERDDFHDAPSRKYKRMGPSRLVRLRNGFVVRCDEVVRGDGDAIERLECSVVPGSLGDTPDVDEKIWGPIHWASATRSVRANVRIYDRFFSVPRPGTAADVDFIDEINPDSLVTIEGAYIEPSVSTAAPESRFQFERVGYFVVDRHDSEPDALVFNRILGLKDTWNPNKSATRPEPRTKDAPKEKPQAAPDPNKVTKEDERAEARMADPVLKAAFERYTGELGLSEAAADVLTGSHRLVSLFDAALAASEAAASNAQASANWFVNDFLGEVADVEDDSAPYTGDALGELVGMIVGGEITGGAGKEVLREVVSNGAEPRALVEERGLAQIGTREALEPIIDAILEREAAQVERYRAGNTKLIGFFIGQVMRETSRRANADLTRSLLAEKLEG